MPKAKAQESSAPAEEPKPPGPIWTIYRLVIKLTADQLGTCTEASIYNEHVLKKAQKSIAEANRLGAKQLKEYEKYKGTEPIKLEKIRAEISGVVRRYQEVLGRKDDLPEDMDELFTYADELKVVYEEAVKAGEQRKATVFMRSPEGKPMISTHMILGNIKENLKIAVNNGDKSIMKSKVAVQEMLALDVKPIEKFVSPDMDLKRNADGTPEILERPIRFTDDFGKTVTAIAMSEVVPEGAEYVLHLRVRSASPLTEANLNQIFELGRNNGLGQWRGSGSKGQFAFKLEKVDYDPTPAVTFRN